VSEPGLGVVARETRDVAAGSGCGTSPRPVKGYFYRVCRIREGFRSVWSEDSGDEVGLVEVA
jgi:hypothetical protein